MGISSVGEPAPQSKKPLQAPSLATQIRYGLLIFTLLSLLIVSGLLMFLSFRAQVAQVAVMQQERSRAAASAIDAHLDEIVRKLGLLAQIQGLTDQPAALQMQLLAALTHQDDAIDMVAITDASGAVQTSIAPVATPIPATFSDSPVFRRALKQPDAIGPVTVDPRTQLLNMLVAVPLRDEHNTVVGVLLAQINLKFLQQVVRETVVGASGYTYVLDNQATLIAANTSDLANGRLQLASGAASPRTPYSGLRGSEVLGARAPVARTNWSVVVELPVAEAYAPARQMVQIMGLALLLALLLAATAGIVFARRIVTPLQQLTSAAQSLSAGQLTTQVAIEHHDELGVLASTFNTMSAQLRRAFEELRISEQRFHAMFDQTFQFIGLLTPAGSVVEINQTALEFSDLRRADVLGKPFWDVPALTSAASQQLLREGVALAAQGQFVRYELEIVGGKGQVATVDFSIKPIIDDQGQVVLLLPEGRDITDRKHMEVTTRQLIREQAARVESERAQERFAFLAEASSILGASLDYTRTLDDLTHLVVPRLADWCVIEMLEADGRLVRLGVAHRDRQQEQVLRTLLEEYPSDLAADHPAVTVLKTRQSLIVDQIEPGFATKANPNPLRLLNPRSSLIVPLIARARLLGVISFIATTPQRYSQADLVLAESLANRAAIAVDNARLYNDAQQAIKARNDFLSLASHELKTPLTTLMGTAQLLYRRHEREKVLNERDQRSVRTISLQAERLNRLITDLLDLSRIEQEALTLCCKPLDLASLIQQVVSESQATLTRHRLVYSPQPAAFQLVGDELRLEQVLHNLIQNAIKYSPSGGQIQIALAQQDGNAWVTIADQGLGIPSAALPHVFQRFYRASNVAPHHISGMGIGLYVVKEILNLHGGAIQVESTEGLGSTFSFSLPLAEAPPVPG